MIPEEKANELIEKFKEFAPFKPYTDKEGTWLYKASEELNAAKQCAAICVENIIAECKFLGTADYRLPYWEEVLTKLTS